MLRWLVLALLLANALFWAWSQGWLKPLFGSAPGAQREPWRLEQQVRPDSVRILPPDAAVPAAPPASAAASAAVSAASAPTVALACFESAPFASAGALDAAEQALAALLPARGWTRASRDTPPQHAVVLGPLARDLLPKKREELARLRLTADEVRLPNEGGAALALGRYESIAAAQAALDGFSQRGVRTGRVLLLAEPGRETRLRFENATPAQAEVLQALKSPAVGALQPCGTQTAGSR